MIHNTEDEIRYMLYALRLQGIGIDERLADQVLVTAKTIQKKKGKFNISDAVDIEYGISNKYAKKKIEENSESK